MLYSLDFLKERPKELHWKRQKKNFRSVIVENINLCSHALIDIAIFIRLYNHAPNGQLI